MSDNQVPNFDYTGKVFPIYFDAPLTIHVDPDTGSMWIQSTQLHPAVTGGVTMRAVLSPGATRQLLQAVKTLESVLGTPIEDLTKPDSVQ